MCEAAVPWLNETKSISQVWYITERKKGQRMKIMEITVGLMHIFSPSTSDYQRP
jgi:hypothetical protein